MVIERTSIANVAAGFVLVLTTIYAYIHNDVQLLRDLAFLAAGYLFGVSAPRWAKP